MTRPEGTWTVLSGGRRGTMTASQAGLVVTLGDETTTFGWSDDLRLEFPTPYSMRICEHDQVLIVLGFASTGEQQAFRQELSPKAPPPEDRTEVLPSATSVAQLAPVTAMTRAFWAGLGVALLGWLLLGVFDDAGVAARFGAFFIWAGSIPLLATLIAWGVKTALESDRD